MIFLKAQSPDTVTGICEGVHNAVHDRFFICLHGESEGIMKQFLAVMKILAKTMSLPFNVLLLVEKFLTFKKHKILP